MTEGRGKKSFLVANKAASPYWRGSKKKEGRKATRRKRRGELQDPASQRKRFLFSPGTPMGGENGEEKKPSRAGKKKEEKERKKSSRQRGEERHDR